MTQQLLISFCNAPSAGSALAGVLDVQSETLVTILQASAQVSSACGLAQNESYVFAACSGGDESYVYIFEKDLFTLVEVLPLEGARDVHSICLDGTAVIAASTGTDEILRFSLDGQVAEVLWRASETRGDTHHLNAVAWHGEHLPCSAFGIKAGTKWHTARNGYVTDVSSGGNIIRGGIYHPHSLFSLGDSIAYCESSLARVHLSSNGFADMAGGYIRGLAFTPQGMFYAGSSVGRTSVETPNEILNPADPGELHGRCEVRIWSMEPRQPCGLIDLSQFGNEIYDLMIAT